MKKGFTCIFLLLFLFSCGQPDNPVKLKTNAAYSANEQHTNLRKMREQYVLSYKKPKTFENQFKGSNGENIKVIGIYYCLMDNGVVVPGKYNSDDTTKAFRTHNFGEYITIVINGDTAVRTAIFKENFNNTLPQYLKDYGVLQEPQFDGYDAKQGAFNFNVSVSIPLSNVSETRRVRIFKDGIIETYKP